MDAVSRQLSNFSASAGCLGNKIQQYLSRLKERINEQQQMNNGEHPWQVLKRLRQENVTKEHVPKPSWEPGIDVGYRQPYKPWSYYFYSVFQWHNESVNVWTHMIGTILMVLYLWHFNHTMDYLNNPRAWPHLLLGICCIITLSASACAHLLHSKSAYVHYVTLSFDYAGAGVYCLGMGFCTIFYTAGNDTVRKIGWYFLPFVTFLSALQCICICYGKIKYSLHHHLRRKIWFVAPTCPPYTTLFLASFPRFVSGYFLNPEPNPIDVESWYLHLSHIGIFFVAMFFFVSHVPEVFANGQFDMLGQGHQIWHVLLFCTMATQMHSTHFDYINNVRDPETLAALPGYESCFYFLGVLIAVDLFLIFCASRLARRVVDEEKQELDNPTVGKTGREDGKDKPQTEETNVRITRQSMRIQRRLVTGTS